MKYRFIEKHQEKYSAGCLCALLGVSCSDYYAWKKCKPSQREKINQELIKFQIPLLGMSSWKNNKDVIRIIKIKTSKICKQSPQCAKDFFLCNHFKYDLVINIRSILNGSSTSFQ